jgi:hypothetical protein
VRLRWSVPSNPDPDNADTIDGWRIYRRDGTITADPTYANRLARLDVAATCVNGACTCTDTTAGASTRTYWETPLDTRLRESATPPTDGMTGTSEESGFTGRSSCWSR